MRLPCPGTFVNSRGETQICGALHIDTGAFATKLHHTHACQICGHTWRPALVNTVGVRFLPGFQNEPEEKAREAREAREGLRADEQGHSPLPILIIPTVLDWMARVVKGVDEPKPTESEPNEWDACHAMTGWWSSQVTGAHPAGPKPSTAACVLIMNDSGHVLATSRKEDPNDWGLPGGKSEEGELPIDTAIRECFEETGYRVSNLWEVFRGPARTDGRTAIVYRAGHFEKVQEPMPGEGSVGWVAWSVLERGSFGEFNKALREACELRTKFLFSLMPLLRFIVQSTDRPRAEVENDVADRFGLPTHDAIRLVSMAVKNGELWQRADGKLANPALTEPPRPPSGV